MEEVYIDSTVFIYGFLDKGEKGEHCRAFLANVSKGKIKGCTCALTFDEVSWKLLKSLEKGTALEAIDIFLTFPGLKFLNVDTSTIIEAGALIKQGLQPRDAIHAASCNVHNISTIISEDKDFQKVGLKRKWVL